MRDIKSITTPAGVICVMSYYPDFSRSDMPKIASITYHEPKGEGDKHYCDVILIDGTMRRYFNLECIEFASRLEE